MNNTHSLDQIQKTDDLNADLTMNQYKLDKMAKYLEIKSVNPRLKRSEIAKLWEFSFSTIQRYIRKINMLSPYRTPPLSKTNHTRKQKTPIRYLDDVKVTSTDLKMNSNDFKTTSNEPDKSKKKKKLNSGVIIEINEKYLCEIIRNNNLWTLICVIIAL